MLVGKFCFTIMHCVKYITLIKIYTYIKLCEILFRKFGLISISISISTPKKNQVETKKISSLSVPQPHASARRSAPPARVLHRAHPHPRPLNSSPPTPPRVALAHPVVAHQATTTFGVFLTSSPLPCSALRAASADAVSCPRPLWPSVIDLVTATPVSVLPSACPPPNSVARGRFLWNAARCFWSTEQISTFYTRSYGDTRFVMPGGACALTGCRFLGRLDSLFHADIQMSLQINFVLACCEFNFFSLVVLAAYGVL
jgi:hypothetical protein